MKAGATIGLVLYEIGALATFAKLTFFDYYDYNWWNWVIAVPINVFLSQIWPIYWVLRWIGEAIGS